MDHNITGIGNICALPTILMYNMAATPCYSRYIGQWSNHCRSRKSIRTNIPMHNLLPVYYPFILQVVSQLYFTSTTPNKDEKIEQLLYCPLMFFLKREKRVLLYGYHGAHGRLRVIQKSASRKKWYKIECPCRSP